MTVAGINIFLFILWSTVAYSMLSVVLSVIFILISWMIEGIVDRSKSI